MQREIMDPIIDEHGDERHPSFGWAQVNRVSVSPPGRSLFDSELMHREIVVLRIGSAARKRDLNHDWIHEKGLPIIEVKMSMVQWGALVSSFGSSGVPVTIEAQDGRRVPEAPHEPRMALSIAEVENAADRSVEKIREAAEALRAAHDRKAGRKEVGELLWTLENRLSNNKPNVRFAADSLTKHVENVVTKAKADIEGMVQMAAAHQIEAGDVAGSLGIGPAQDDA